MSVLLVYGAGDDNTMRVARGAFRMMKALKEDGDASACATMQIVDAESGKMRPLEINPVVLRMVVDFCEHLYKFQDKLVAAGKTLTAAQTENLDVWKRKFCEDKQERIFELLLAADDLGVTALMDVVGKAIGAAATGKNVEQLRAMWGIENDFSPEEEDHLRRENEWCEQR